MKEEKETADDEDSGYFAALEQLLRDTYNNEINPAMDAALSSKDDRSLSCALQRALSWKRGVELLGLSGKFYKKAKKKIWNFFKQALEIAAENSFQRCSREHKPEEVGVLLGIKRQQELLGFDSSKTMDYYKRCARLELEFDSETAYENGGLTITMHVNARVDIDPFAIEVAMGEAPLEYFTFKVTPKCGSAAIQSFTGSSFVVLSVNFDLNPRTIGDCVTPNSAGSLRLVSIDIQPSTTSESFTVMCPPAPPVPATDGSWWTGSFFSLHEQELSGARSFRITGWEPGNGSLLGRWTSNRFRQISEVLVSGQTVINLWHRPE